jgi:hypothetical protein
METRFAVDKNNARAEYFNLSDKEVLKRIFTLEIDKE